MSDVRAVTLLSGGLDSTVLLYRLMSNGLTPTALSVNYGQRHVRELASAEMIAAKAGVPHIVVDLGDALAPIFALSQSSQVGTKVPVPEGHYAAANMSATVVPNRNMLLISVAGALADSIGAKLVAYAAHAGDHPIYPDCRPEFIASCASTLLLATGVTLYDPFAEITKANIVTMGHELGVPFELTWSCYSADNVHCGRCGTCCERAEAFSLAGVPDPTIYASPDFWKTVQAPA